jgi:hypothetical protein
MFSGCHGGFVRITVNWWFIVAWPQWWSRFEVWSLVNFQQVSSFGFLPELFGMSHVLTL